MNAICFAGDKISYCHSHTYDRETQGKYWLAACAVEEGETPFKQTKLEQFSHYPSYLLDMIPRYAWIEDLAFPLTDKALLDTCKW